MTVMTDAPEALPRPAALKEPVRLTGRDWLLLAACLLLAALFWLSFDRTHPFLQRAFRECAGLSFTLFLLGGLAAALLRLGRREYTRQQQLLLAVYVALALSFTLLGDPLLRRLNLLVSVGLVPLTLFSLAGQTGSPWQAEALTRTLGRLFPSLFRYSLTPPADLLRRAGEPGRRGRALLLGLLLALPLLLAAGLLLASADAVFRDLFLSVEEWLANQELDLLLWRVLRVLVVGLCGFSLLYTLTRPAPPRKEAQRRLRLPLLTWNVALILLNAVYLLFVVIQFTVLFGGNETAAIRGGFAEYARSGFFQLVLVALLNLTLLAAARRSGPTARSLRLNGSLLLAATAVILVSALWRMLLYIRAFGFSVPRALTLWGMAVIAVAIVLSLLKLWRPALSVFPLLLGIVLASWLAFNYSGVDRWVADYNADHYLSGQLEQVDGFYMAWNLSPASRPALIRLANAGCGEAEEALSALNDYAGMVDWEDWSLPWLIYK